MRATLIALLLFLAPALAPAQAPAPAPALPGAETSVTQFEVNGLKVLVKARPSTQTVIAGLFLRGGVANQTPETAGLEALMLVGDKERFFLLSGTGDVLEPDGECHAIGSGGPYALAAARALCAHTQLSAKDVAVEALKVAADICVFTNNNIVVEELT